MAQWKACVCRVVPETPLTRSVHCLLYSTEVLGCSTSSHQGTQLSFGRQSLSLWKPVSFTLERSQVYAHRHSTEGATSDGPY